jgi:hypothetical protein
LRAFLFGRRLRAGASRRSSGSTAGSAPSASSAETEDHSGEPAPTRLSLTAARGEARPLVSARPGSGRSRFAGPRRRTRLEGPAQAKAAIRPHDSVQNSSPTSVWKLWKSPVVEPQAHAGLSSGAVRRLYDARPGVWSLERVRCGKNLGKSANFYGDEQVPVLECSAEDRFGLSLFPTVADGLRGARDRSAR